MLNQNTPQDQNPTVKPWWQEVQEPPSKVLHNEVLLPEERDIGEELEEEARQRALLTGQEMVIPLSVVSTLRKSRQRFHRIHFPIAALFMIAAIVLMIVGHTTALLPGASILCIEFLALYFYMLHREKHPPESNVVLSPEGIQVTAGNRKYGPIFWEEISEIYEFRFYRVNFIGIRFKNTRALATRLGGPEGKSLLFAGRITGFYKVFGSRLAPLNISVSSLPMTAETFMAQVAIMKNSK